jgi:ABC-type transporter Mla MlaB component
MSTKISTVTVSVNEGAGVGVTGVLDASTVDEVNRVVAEFLALDCEDLEVLTLDLSTVTTCDQAALAAVRHARALCAEQSLALRVIPNDAVRHAMCPRP